MVVVQFVEIKIVDWIDEFNQWKGIIPATTKLLLDFSFDKWNVDRFEIDCRTHNKRNQGIAACEEISNKREDTLMMNGVVIKSIIYVLRNPNF